MSRKMPNLNRLVESRRLQLVFIGAGLAVLVLLALPVFAASSPSFFSQFHSFEKSYETLESSAHEGIDCTGCHGDAGGRVVYSAAVVADFYGNLVKKEKSATFVKFPKPTNEACLACHGTEWSDDASRTARIPHPAHLRLASETRECVKCHKWVAHEEVQMKKHKEMPFSGVCVAYGCHVGVKTSDDCYTCHHVLDETAVNWKTEHPIAVQEKGANGCLETCHSAEQCRQCHTTGKRPTFTGLATETGLKEIEGLHTKSDWIKRHGPEAIRAGQDKCLKCHVSDGECRDCHTTRPESHGPTESWIGQHKNVAKTVDDARCLTCHKKPWCEDCHKQFKEMR